MSDATRKAAGFRRPWVLACSAMVIAAAASCGGGEPADGDDGRAAFGPIEAEPFVTLGGASAGGAEPSRIAGVHRLPDGTTVVAGARRLHWFDPAGRPVQAARGEVAGVNGGGDLVWMSGYRADSVVVYDAASGRLSVLDASGSVARRFRLAGESPRGFLEPHSAFPDGSLLAMMGPVHVEERSRGWWSVVHLVAFGPEGERRERLGAALLHPCDGDVERCAARVETYRGAWTAGDGGVYVARPDRAEIGFITPTTATVLGGPARWTGDPEERVPTYATLLLDSEGQLWAQTGDGSRAAVFDAAGELAGTVRVPAGLRIHQVGLDFVAGVTDGEDGDERVEVYRLHRDGSGVRR